VNDPYCDESRVTRTTTAALVASVDDDP